MQLAPSIAAAIGAVSPQIDITSRPLLDRIDAALTRERVMALLSGLFGAMALLLAGLGLYGVTAYSVAYKRTDIAIASLSARPGGALSVPCSCERRSSWRWAS